MLCLTAFVFVTETHTATITTGYILIMICVVLQVLTGAMTLNIMLEIGQKEAAKFLRQN